MHKWLNTPLGATLLTTEALVVNSEVAEYLGDNLLLLGDPRFMRAVEQSPIANKFLTHAKGVSDLNPSCFSRYDKLAFSADSMHLVYAAHVLGELSNPHETLREIARVLVPEGVVVITGFNPLSTWGLRRLATRFNKTTPWDHDFLSLNRLMDWLQLLGFVILNTSGFFRRLPINNNNILAKTQILEKCSLLPSGAYVIVARKRVVPITLIRDSLTRKNSKIINDAILARAAN